MLTEFKLVKRRNSLITQSFIIVKYLLKGERKTFQMVKLLFRSSYEINQALIYQTVRELSSRLL